MRGFLVRTASLLVILGTLTGYNKILENREREERYAKLSAQVEALETYIIQSSQKAQTSGVQEADQERAIQEGADQEGAVQDGGLYADGEWEGEAEGFGGPIVLKVTVENGAIADITLVSAEKEAQAYLAMAKEMLPAMIEAQSADVDTVTGATFSSTGIKNAAAQALEKAER